jgi:ABC-type bacteriocin/lantibiotic exporter with double-glycine peptidase domain
VSTNHDTPPPAPRGKGRATPSRKDAEAARRRPLVPADRKAARQADREAARRSRTAEQAAMMTGDERHLPPQHRGPQRRFARDFVDGRRNMGEYFLILALIALGASLLSMVFLDPAVSIQVSNVVNVVLVVGLLTIAVDSFLLQRSLRAALAERFGATESGMAYYGIMRALQIRAWRMPKPQVKRGQQPTASRG